jgi:hypothetical protein
MSKKRNAEKETAAKPKKEKGGDRELVKIVLDRMDALPAGKRYFSTYAAYEKILDIARNI